MHYCEEEIQGMVLDPVINPLRSRLKVSGIANITLTLWNGT